MKISDYPLWTSVFTVLTCHLIFNREGMWIYILSSMIFGLFYYLIRLISKRKLGMGDVYFGFFQGLCLPPSALPVCVAAEVILALVIVNKKIGHKAFPFVPFMSVGLIISYVIFNFR